MVGKSLEIPVFYPTLKDVQGSFEAYMTSIEKRFSSVGVCKIVPPKGWTPRKQGYSDRLDVEIPRPIRQHATGTRGVYRTLLVEGKPMSLRNEFRPLATAKDNLPPPNSDQDDLERRFWRNVTLQPPLYGADVPGSLFDANLKGWNLRHLDSLLSRTLGKKGLKIDGVSTPYLYFGMWRSIFAWHTEDMDLHSVNYLHFGSPKSWYIIPPAYRERFETLLKGTVPDLFRSCPEFLRHKELLVSPQLLQHHNIPVLRMTQHPGEFIINYAGAYHSGFNHGYNCAESTNFATRSWIAIGADAGVCSCHEDSVKIQMSLFADDAPPGMKRRLKEMAAAEEESSDEDSESESEASERPAKRRKVASGSDDAKQGKRQKAGCRRMMGQTVSSHLPKQTGKRGGTDSTEESQQPVKRQKVKPKAEDTGASKVERSAKAAPAEKADTVKSSRNTGSAKLQVLKRRRLSEPRQAVMVRSVGRSQGKAAKAAQGSASQGKKRGGDRDETLGMLHGPKSPLRRRRASASGLHGAEMRALRLRLRSGRS